MTPRSELPVGTVLLWEGKPAVRREPEGWRYTTGRFLGCNEVEELDTRPYTVQENHAALDEALDALEAQVRAAPDEDIPADLEAALLAQLHAAQIEGHVRVFALANAPGPATFPVGPTSVRESPSSPRRIMVIDTAAIPSNITIDTIDGALRQVRELHTFRPSSGEVALEHGVDVHRAIEDELHRMRERGGPRLDFTPKPKAPKPAAEPHARTAEDHRALDVAKARRARRQAKRLREAAHGGIERAPRPRSLPRCFDRALGELVQCEHHDGDGGFCRAPHRYGLLQETPCEKLAAYTQPRR